MCEFCHKHGEGKKWYLNARNYADDLLSDLRRRRFIADFFSHPERVAKAMRRLERLDAAPVSSALAAAGVVLLAVVIGLLYSECLRRTYVYFVSNQRCVFRGGIIVRVERSVPYHKVTDVEMRQNIVERMLGISKLNIFTPGTASVVNSPFGGPRAEISFVGLADSETPAATINETLRGFKATGE